MQIIYIYIYIERERGADPEQGEGLPTIFRDREQQPASPVSSPLPHI